MHCCSQYNERCYIVIGSYREFESNGTKKDSYIYTTGTYSDVIQPVNDIFTPQFVMTQG
jgi:hypothetical protein